MMTKAIIAFVVVVTFASFSVQGQGTGVCGPNAVWSKCLAHCEVPCNEADVRGCPRGCKSGCKCKPGYRLTSWINPQCVLPQDCPVDMQSLERNCPKNSFWTDCGSSCPKICNDSVITCVQKCTPRCECKRGFIQTKSGLCIPNRDCYPLAKRIVSFMPAVRKSAEIAEIAEMDN